MAEVFICMHAISWADVFLYACMYSSRARLGLFQKNLAWCGMMLFYIHVCTLPFIYGCMPKQIHTFLILRKNGQATSQNLSCLGQPARLEPLYVQMTPTFILALCMHPMIKDLNLRWKKRFAWPLIHTWTSQSAHTCAEYPIALLTAIESKRNFRSITAWQLSGKQWPRMFVEDGTLSPCDRVWCTHKSLS